MTVIRRFIIFAVCLLPAALLAAPEAAPAVRVWQDSMVIPTSEEGLPDPNPPFDEFRERGPFNYPYTLRHNLVDRRSPRKWPALPVHFWKSATIDENRRGRDRQLCLQHPYPL